MQGQSCSLFIDSGSVLNGVFHDLVSKLVLTTEPFARPYEIMWINGENVSVSLKCKLDFHFGRVSRSH